MLGMVSDRVLGELGAIRAVLSGEMPRTALPPMPSLGEEDHRNRVAVGMVERLGNMLNRVRDVSGELEGVVFALAGPNRKGGFGMVEPPEEEKVFGFASARKAA